MSMCILVCMCVCMYVCVYVRMYVCVCVDGMFYVVAHYKYSANTSYVLGQHKWRASWPS